MVGPASWHWSWMVLLVAVRDCASSVRCMVVGIDGISDDWAGLCLRLVRNRILFGDRVAVQFRLCLSLIRNQIVFRDRIAVRLWHCLGSEFLLLLQRSFIELLVSIEEGSGLLANNFIRRMDTLGSLGKGHVVLWKGAKRVHVAASTARIIIWNLDRLQGSDRVHVGPSAFS